MTGPIGVFDSGVGGLTVAAAILRKFPDERVLYLADQAHVPYGGRPLNEIRELAFEISRFLAEQGCRGIVMGCNISSAVALDVVAESLTPIPVFGVIAPAARRAAESESRIGLLATQGTVTSGSYTEHILRANPRAFVREIACPRFVPLVEAGEMESDEAHSAAHEYLRPLAESGCRAIILGCTHYPFLLPVLSRAAAELMPNPVIFIDPADEAADQIRGIGGSAGTRPNLLLTTGDTAIFDKQIPRFLPGVEFEMGQSEWIDGGRLALRGITARSR